MSNFSTSATVRFNRSKFNLSHGVKTSMNVGTLYPIDVQEVLPGDTFKAKMNGVFRVTSSFVKPVMDNLYLDAYHFFVPMRLVYEDFERIFGNPNPSAYVETELSEVPMFSDVTSDNVTVPAGTVYDYLSLPNGIPLSPDISCLLARCFAKIYDDWFRNENTVPEMYIQKGACALSELPNINPWAPNNYSGRLPKVMKTRDYFTSALPSPQKGQATGIPISVGDLPVITKNVEHDINPYYLRLVNGTGEAFPTQGTLHIYDNKLAVDPNGTIPATGAEGLVPSNLYVDGSSAETVFTVNDLRLAFQTQKMLERDARNGSRYVEYLNSAFGVTSPDARLQRSEYLGGGRIPLNIQQVEQNSQSTEDSPLGNLAGYSWTNGSSFYNKGFVEHGYVFTVCAIKQVHTYQQGIDKMFTRRKRIDFYDPLFANLGEQPIYVSEIFANASAVGENNRDKVFGYNEAWADYRYKPSKVTGQMRSTLSAEKTLDVWHFADKFNNAPTLSQGFTNETENFVDRTLTVPSSLSDQFIADFWFNTEAIRVMPTYSIPGLIDHH